MALKCACTVELSPDLTFVSVADNPNSLTESWITYEGSYNKKPKCDAPCDTIVPSCDWTISVDEKNPSSAPDPVLTDMGTPDAPKCRVTVTRDASYTFKLTLKVTVKCKKKLGESNKVIVYEPSEPPCSSEASATGNSEPH